jgi:hypothetical protein
MPASLFHPYEAQSALCKSSYAALFGSEPIQVFPYSDFTRPDGDIRIEVLVYSLRGLDNGHEFGKDHVALLTNGLSSEGRPRRELIQYFAHGRRTDAHRIHSAAYSAVEMGRWLDFGSAVTLPYPSGSAWPHTVFLPPPVTAHSDFQIAVEGDPVKLLWHVPLSDAEFAYQRDHGIPALLRGMSNAALPWFFDETTRPMLGGSSQREGKNI